MKILVSTTVIEVGVDVPNATVMLIEQAERFGLAQLHQLRGRVGRGGEQSYCILVTGKMSDAGRERIRTMVDSIDGFYIAEMDLKLRGPGEFFGTRQSGSAHAADRQHHSRPGCAGGGAQRGAGVHREAAVGRGDAARGELHPRALAAPLRIGAGGLMRVIGGEFRSRRLKSVPGLETRPTPDRLREALFNVLAPRMEGAIFMDVYAGTGAVGIEALSRGAKRCVFVEKNRGAVAVIRENLAALGLENRAEVYTSKPAPVMERVPADIVFLDAPYELESEREATLAALGALKHPLVIVQHASRDQPGEEYGSLRRYRVLKQGDNSLSFYRQNTHPSCA